MNSYPTYPFPTPGDDVLQARFEIQPPHYSLEQLNAAAHLWQDIKSMNKAELYIRLQLCTEGCIAEAIVLFDAMVTCMDSEEELRLFLDRPVRHYKRVFGEHQINERAIQRGIADLIEFGILQAWPQNKAMGNRFRLDFVALAERIQATFGMKFPGLDVNHGV